MSALGVSSARAILAGSHPTNTAVLVDGQGDERYCIMTSMNSAAYDHSKLLAVEANVHLNVSTGLLRCNALQVLSSRRRPSTDHYLCSTAHLVPTHGVTARLVPAIRH